MVDGTYNEQNWPLPLQIAQVETETEAAVGQNTQVCLMHPTPQLGLNSESRSEILSSRSFRTAFG